jgi:hypothetical protein
MARDSLLFLYSDFGLFADAYFITPDPEGLPIQHQYGCVGCSQFEVVGKLEKVESELAKKIVYSLGHCSYPAPEVLSLETGLDVVDVLGEGLAKLADGSFIAVETCD